MKWGSGEGAADIPVTLPIHSCTDCDIEYFDQHGERLRHEAICRHLGVLSPWEIRSIRAEHGMTRVAFAHAMGVDESKIGRWENGLEMQDLATDRRLRFMAKAES